MERVKKLGDRLVNYQPLKGLASFPTLYVSCSTCSHCKVG